MRSSRNASVDRGAAHELVVAVRSVRYLRDGVLGLDIARSNVHVVGRAEGLGYPLWIGNN